MGRQRRARIDFPALLRRACDDPTWQRGVCFDLESFRHDAYVKGYGGALLNADARVMSLDELLSTDFASSAELFVRPVDDDKRFTGCTLRFSDLATEWRLFMVDARVVGGSMYRPSADRVEPWAGRRRED